MKKIYLSFLLLGAILFQSCDEDIPSQQRVISDSEQQIPGSVNKTGNIEGVSYKFKNLVLNPECIVMNLNEQDILSSKEQINKGIFKISNLPAEIEKSLKSGAPIYINTELQSYLRRINSLEKSDNLVTLLTEQADPGELIQSGSIEINADIGRFISSAANSTNSLSGRLDDDKKYVNIIDRKLTLPIKIDKPIETDFLLIKPNIAMKFTLTAKFGFEKNRLLSNKSVLLYTFEPDISPYILFKKANNYTFKHDMVDFLPESIKNVIENFKFKIRIPAGPFGVLPAEVQISKVNLPFELNAHVANDNSIEYNANGNLTFGIKTTKGLIGRIFDPISNLVFENSIQTRFDPKINLDGEVTTKYAMDVIPKISFVDDLFSASANFHSELYTTSTGTIRKSSDLPISPPVVGSKGILKINFNYNIKSLDAEAFEDTPINFEHVLWDFGKLNKTIKFSNIVFNKPESSHCVSEVSYAGYDYTIQLNYKYSQIGKKLGKKLKIEYDVLDDNKNLLLENESQTFEPNEVTDNQFKFSLCLPLKKDPLAILDGFTVKYGYLTNIRISDEDLNVGKGIYSKENNKIQDTIFFASPFNKDYW